MQVLAGRAVMRRAGRAVRTSVVAVAVGMLVISLAAPPAAAESRDLIVNGTFDAGAGHNPWWVTGNLTPNTTSHELCVNVPAGGNQWDSIVGQKNLLLENNISYVLSFDAHASSAVTIKTQVQSTVTAPAVSVVYKQQNVSLGVATQHVDIAFTPALGTSQVDSQLQYRIGGTASAYTFCVDNVSLSGAYPDVVDPLLGHDELLTNGTFTTGNGSKPWWTNSNMAMDTSTQEICLSVPTSVNIYDRLLGQNSIVLGENTKYVLSFDAHATTTVRIGSNVQPFDNPNKITYLASTSTVGTTPRHFSYPFTTSLGVDHMRSQLQLRLGGVSSTYSICLDNISLLGTAYHYVPDTHSPVKVNQVGYLPQGPKKATLVTSATTPLTWVLKQNGTEVTRGATTPAGLDSSAGVNVHTIDFTAVTAVGDGFTLEAEGHASNTFPIRANIYQSLRTDALRFFYTNRSGIAIDGSLAGAEYARAAGHVGVAPNQGDLSVPCQDPQSYTNNWTCAYSLDVRGGWYDAGDHGKYVVNGGIAAYQLLSTWERAVSNGTQAPLGDSTLNIPERGNGVPDILDEARWELQFLLEMQVPDGQPLAGMAHHKIDDAEWTGPPMAPAADPKRRVLHRPSTAATLNLAAVAAQGARLFQQYDAAFSAQLLAAARKAYTAATQNPSLLAPSEDSIGGGAYADSTVSDEFYWAEAELYITTGDAAYKSAVLADPLHTDSSIFTPGGFYWGGVAPLARMDLARFAPQLPGIDTVRASVINAAGDLATTEESQPFGQPYAPTGGLYAWGSNASILNNQVLMATAFDLNHDPRLARAVVAGYDYLFGRNALSMSYVTGYGTTYAQNQHSRMYARSLDSTLPNPPVGSVSGGPNSSLQDPIAQQRVAGCAAQMCYVDDIEAWSVNEITVNWNSALTWVASFVADLGAGASTVSAPVQITTSPGDVSVADGDDAHLTAAATGNPAPTVAWQKSTDGVAWAPVAGATGTTLDLIALTAADDGMRYRAVFTNGVGAAVATNVATITVVPPATPSPSPSPSASPGPSSSPAPSPSASPGPSSSPAPSPSADPSSSPSSPTTPPASPAPAPGPSSSPVPAPSPGPSTSPAPSPTPSTSGSPAPGSPPADPSPSPDPSSTPTQPPNPSPSPTPVPTPAPTANPSPAPTANPLPAPSPSPSPTPAPNPAPEPDPSPAPNPAPSPTPVPYVESSPKVATSHSGTSRTSEAERTPRESVLTDMALVSRRQSSDLPPVDAEGPPAASAAGLDPGGNDSHRAVLLVILCLGVLIAAGLGVRTARTGWARRVARAVMRRKLRAPEA